MDEEKTPIVAKEPNGDATAYGASRITAGVKAANLGKHYQHALLDCGTCEICFLSFFCVCIANSLIARRLNVFACYPRCFGVLPLAVHFRSLTGIEEDFCFEGLQSWVCPCCFTNRLLQEMELRGFNLKKQTDDCDHPDEAVLRE